MKMSWSILSLVVFLAASPAHAWVENVEKLASAQPQECWMDIGVRAEPISTDPLVCPEGSSPYTPQTYTWSMAVVPAEESPEGQGEQVWFGTGGNVLCTTQGGFFSEVDSSEGRSSVCEFGESIQKQNFPGLPDAMGDWYPPNFYQYDVNTRTQTDHTPYTDPLRNRSMGLRGAGYHNGVVFFGGGSLGGGISLFAFNAKTGEYLGSQLLEDYRTFRKGEVVNNVLYLGVGTEYMGRILRWTGSLSDPFSFVEVGVVQGAIRELTGYVDSNGRTRLAVTSKGVYVSPPMYGTGLVPRQRNRWIEAWSPSEYDPDYTTRTTYVGGGIGFLNGWLYFGTMHIPLNAADLHMTCVIPPYNFELPSSVCMGDPGDDYASSYKYRAAWYGTSRATSIWRIRNPESSNRETQLLYGEATLPAYNPDYPEPPAEDASSEEWEEWMEQIFPETPNVGGYVPLLGSSGFGNSCNNYAWVFETIENSLFMGTMDYCSMGSTSTESGADVWRIGSEIPDVIDPDDPDKYQAVAETTKAFKCGAGDLCQPCQQDQWIYNYAPYGIRTLKASTDGTRMYVGTATGVNLNAVDDGAGYQLLMLDSVNSEAPTWYYDGDGDGYGVSDTTLQQQEQPSEDYVSLSCDCDDQNPDLNPGATEICGNGIDDDCDGSVDECQTYYLDADDDSYGTNDVTMEALSTPEGYDRDGGDCDDANPAVNPRATEICDNGIDDNCNGLIDNLDVEVCQ